MTGLDPAGQARRVLARVYDWIIFTIAAMTLLFQLEFTALDIMWLTARMFTTQPDMAGTTWWTRVPNDPIHTSSEPFVQLLALLMFITPMVLVFLYEIPLVALCGQTVGKMMTGIRIVRSDNGQPPGWGRSIRRWLVLYGPMLIPSIGWLITLLIYLVSSKLDPHGRPLHDRIAGTTVIVPHSPS